MPKYTITDPHGKEWEIDGPEGATRQQVIERISNSTEYKNAQYLRQKTSKTSNPTNTLPPVEGMPEEKGTTSAPNWWKDTTPEEKYDPPAKDVLEAARRNTRDALRRSWEQLKNSNLTPEQKAFHRQEFEKQLAEENKDLQIDYEKLPWHKRLLMQAPGAAAVAGTGLAGFLAGGPPGAFAAGGTTLAALTGGAGEGQRAQLELQGVDAERAKQVGQLEGLVKPAMQIGAATVGPVAGAVGVPFASDAVEAMKNRVLQDQIHGPRTQEFPIQPFRLDGTDAAIQAATGFVAGLPGRTPPTVGRTPPPTPPQAPAGRQLPGPGPRPSPPPPGPSGTPPSPPPAPPSGGAGPVVPKPGQSVRGAINERLATKMAEPVKSRPNIDIFINALDDAPKSVTTAGKTVTSPTKPPAPPSAPPVRNVPALTLPPASPNPLGPTPTVTQDGRVATTAGRPDAANTSVKDDAQVILEGMSPQDVDTLQNDRLAPTWGASKIPPELKDDFKEWRNDFFDPADREVAMAPENIAETEARYLESVMDDPEHPYHTLTAKTEAGGPPDLGPGYEDSLGSPASRFAPPEGKAPLRADTATNPAVRQAIAAREPIETLPPNRRVQEGPGVSRQQVADQQALVKKLTYAGYREVKPGVWVHGDAPKKKVKDDPNWGKSRADRKPVTPDDVTEGNAFAEEIYKVPNDIDRLDRVWGSQLDGAFVPWIKNTSLTPAKVNPKSTFIIANYHLNDNRARAVTAFLGKYVDWFPIVTLPNDWQTFKEIYGPVFLSNGYDALSMQDPNGQPMLINFDPSNVTFIPETTAKTITGEKIKEHVRQMKNVLWMKRDRLKEQEEAGLRAIKTLANNNAPLSDIADAVAATAPSPGLRALGKQISDTIRNYEKAGLYGRLDVMERTPEKFGDFQMMDGKLVVRTFGERGFEYRTIIHEMIHAITIPTLAIMKEYAEDATVEQLGEDPMVQRYYDLRKKMGEFYSFLQQMLPTLKLMDGEEVDEDIWLHNTRVTKLLYNKSPWTENVHEVLAYALTEPGFQRILHNIPIEEGNGLWGTTEAVRNFHGITEDMNTIFFEAVKLFNEFASQPIWNISTLPKLAQNITSSVYQAKPEIRGPPDFDRAVLTHLDEFGSVMVMSGNTELPYVVGLQKLEAATQTVGAILTPVMNGSHLFAFNQGRLPAPTTQGTAVVPGQPPQTPAAPMYVMGVPKAVVDQWDAPRKTGQTIGNMVYFLVDNTDHPPIIGAMRRMAHSTFLDRDEAIRLIEKGIDVQKAVKPFLEEDRTRRMADMLPKAVRPSTKVMQQLKEAEAWEDLDFEEAMAIWRANPVDIPPSYEFWGQMVSGAETAAALTNHPLIRWMRGQISKDIAEQAQMSKQVIQPMGELYLKMNNKDRVQIMQLLKDADRQEIEYTEVDLRNMGLTDDQVSLAMLIREADNYLYDLWNEKRYKLGLKPVPFRKGHIPSIFDGDYRGLVVLPGQRNPKAPNRRQNHPAEDGDEILGVLSANDRLTYNKRKKEALATYPGARIRDLPVKTLDGAPLNGNLFDIYMELTKALGPNDPNIMNLQHMLQEFAKFDENRYLGFHVHELAKKGIWGSSGDKPWKTDIQNANEMFDALVRYFQEGTAHHNMLEFMQDMDKMFLDPQVNDEAPHMLRYARDLYTHVLRHNPVTQGEGTHTGKVLKMVGTSLDRAVGAALYTAQIGPTHYHAASGTVRYAFATWAMGLGNLAFSFLQLMQVPLFAPQMTMMLRKELGMSFTEGRADAAKAAVALAKYMSHHISNGKSDRVFGPLDSDKETHFALTYAEDNNLINFTDIERALEHVVSPTRSKIDRVVNFNQRYAEVLTRPLVFLWFFNLNRSAGLPMKEALETARHRTQFVMVPYDLRDRPMAYASLGSLGMAFGQLKTFMHSSTSQAWYYTKQMKKGTFRPFIYGASMAMFFQGQMGLIGMQDADNLVRGINHYVNKENKGLKEVIYENAPKWFSQGVMTEWTGVDFYSRLRSPGVIQFPLQASIIPSAYGWLGGVIGHLKRLGSITEKMEMDWATIQKSTEYQKSILGLTPPALKAIVEETESFRGKFYKENAAPLTGFTRDDFDRTLRYMGMRSARESRWMETMRDRGGDKYLLGLDKAEIKNKLIEAYRKGYFKGEYVRKLENDFLLAGGSVQELKSLMKTLPPQTPDDDFFGRPSKRGASRLMELYEMDQKRKQQ